jgi:fused signal recognition particle receptor
MFQFLGKKIREIFSSKVDENIIVRLEELFYQADLGTQICSELSNIVRTLCKKNPQISVDELLDAIKQHLLKQLQEIPSNIAKMSSPHVILIVGVNGNGKTTSIAKLAHHYKREGKKVLIAAADTFRAAAIDQLERWSVKTSATLVKGKPGSDPAAVVFDAIEAAKSRQYDIVLIDTAGRLHTKTDLMNELQKIYRVTGKACPGAPHETLLVLDTTIGQNGIEQATTFHQYTPITGLLMTKCDGTAKGGAALAIQKKLRFPIKYLGTGEAVEALESFHPQSYINNLFA